jgi:ParB family chromosome partitioning protein
MPCVVHGRDGAILPEEVSLAENIERAPLHPLNQFLAFQDMRDKGMRKSSRPSSCRVAVVKQRLRLTSASPSGIHHFEDGLSLRRISADHNYIAMRR